MLNKILKFFKPKTKEVTMTTTTKSVYSTAIDMIKANQQLASTVHDKISYLGWRDHWRATYKALSTLIHEHRRTLKLYKYEYRAKGDNKSQRRKITGPNPLRGKSPFTSWEVAILRSYATNLLQLRADMKVEAKKRYEEAKNQRKVA